MRGLPDRVRGSGRVKEARVVDAAGERRWPCDTLVIDAPRAPAYAIVSATDALVGETSRFAAPLSCASRANNFSAKALFAAIDKMPHRPAWTAYLVPQNIDIKRLNKQLAKYEVDFFHGGLN